MKDKYVNINAVYNTLIEHYAWFDTATAKIILEEILDKVPPADVVAVVRCKNCKSWDKFPNCDLSTQFHACRNHFSIVGTTASDFCSYGEKEDEIN